MSNRLCACDQVLYYAIGRSLVLQPSQAHWFSAGAPYHPMLPPLAGLYVLQDPPPLVPPPGAVPPHPEWPELTPAAQSVGHESPAGSAASTPAGSPTASLDSAGPNGGDASGSAMLRGDAAEANAAASGATPMAAGDDAAAVLQQGTLSRAEQPAAAAANAVAARNSRRVPSARAALSSLMDNPHPLDILGDPAAYGPEGGISRFHNPDNYTAALGGAHSFCKLFAFACCSLHPCPLLLSCMCIEDPVNRRTD